MPQQIIYDVTQIDNPGPVDYSPATATETAGITTVGTAGTGLRELAGSGCDGWPGDGGGGRGWSNDRFARAAAAASAAGVVPARGSCCTRPAERRISMASGLTILDTRSCSSLSDTAICYIMDCIEQGATVSTRSVRHQYEQSRTDLRCITVVKSIFIGPVHHRVPGCR